MKRGKLLLLIGTVAVGTLVGIGPCFSDLLFAIAPFLL